MTNQPELSQKIQAIMLAPFLSKYTGIDNIQCLQIKILDSCLCKPHKAEIFHETISTVNVCQRI